VASSALPFSQARRYRQIPLTDESDLPAPREAILAYSTQGPAVRLQQACRFQSRKKVFEIALALILYKCAYFLTIVAEKPRFYKQ